MVMVSIRFGRIRISNTCNKSGAWNEWGRIPIVWHAFQSNHIADDDGDGYMR